MFEHANTRKHISEQSCSSVGVFLSILAHLAHLASAFFIESRINGLIFGYVSEHASTKKHVSEHCCSSVWVFSSILAQSFLISTGIKRQMFWYMSENANTRKNIYQHNCSSVRMFFEYSGLFSTFGSVFFSDFKWDK